jgi:hypothetical protein
MTVRDPYYRDPPVAVTSKHVFVTAYDESTTIRCVREARRHMLSRAKRDLRNLRGRAIQPCKLKNDL